MNKKSKFFDLFKKETFEINGNIVVKPRSKAIIPIICTLAFFIICCLFIPVSGINFKFDQFPVLIKRMFTPNKTKDWAGWFTYMFNLKSVLLETLKMTFLGTFFGSVLCVPVSILASRNIVKKAWIFQPVRVIMNFIRTIPTLVLAVVAMLLFGIGAFPGVVSISIFTFGLMTKMMYEIIETVDMGPYEALESTGATKIQAFCSAVVPQILPIFLGYFIYAFEINVRGSVVLGYVGAGGIGVELDNAMSNMYYDQVGAIVVVLFFLVLILQLLTRVVRGKLQ